MITRKDVAKRAGVSVTIVSRTLNNNGYVAKEKREAVIKAAEELGYRPNPIALSLHNRRTRQILFYSKDLGNMFNIELYRGMVDYARQRDYNIILSGWLKFADIRTMMIDGVILPNEYIAYQYVEDVGKNFNLPVVCAAYSSISKPPRNMPYIISDTYEATELLIHYLRDKGHRKIALATPYQLNIFQPRHIAYITMMRPVLGDRLEDYVFNSCKSDKLGYLEEHYTREGEMIAREIVRSNTDATAVICFNDDFAMGMCHQLQLQGIRVPEDLSIVGIDKIGIGKYLTPTLTTVDISPAKQGRECVRTLLDMLDGSPVPTSIQLPVHLVEGESVKDVNL